MTPEEIRERIRLLSERRQGMLDQINALGAELGRVEGALQDCEFWLKRIEAPESAASEPLRLVSQEG